MWPVADLDDDDLSGPAVKKLIQMVLLFSIKDRASEVIFEPGQDIFHMRYKVGGIYYDMVPPPPHLAPNVVNVLKIMAGLDYAGRRRPRQGFMRLKVDNRLVTALLAVRPTWFGEAAVVYLVNGRGTEKQARQSLLVHSRLPDTEDAFPLDIEDSRP